MMVLKIYNFCPRDIEIAKIMTRMRRINKRSGFRLISFSETPEKKIRDGNTDCGCVCYCRDDCRVSDLTSILTYGPEEAKSEKENFSDGI